MNYAVEEMGKNYYIKKILYNPVRIFVFAASILSTIFIAYNVSHPGYEYLFLLPLVYGVMFVFFISPVVFKNTNIFLSVFAVYTFTRYIVLPFLIVYAGHYGGRSTVPPLNSTFQLAIWLMTYEIVVISLVTYLLFRKVKNEHAFKNSSVILPKNYFIYVVFLGITFLLVLLYPSTLKSFYFLVPPDNLADWTGISLISSITFYFLVISKFIVYLLIMSFLYRKYLLTNKSIYVLLSYLITLLNIFIIFGSNRADFIITSIASIVLFYKLYPKQSKVALVVIAIFVVIITSIISTHRNIATYTGGADRVLDLANTLQIYMGGPYNVAIAIEASHYNQEARNLINFGYDMLRPTLGLNVLLKNLDLKTSTNYFNERIYFEERSTQIIPIIGQGYFFFNFVFSPVIMIMFLFFVRFLINVRQKKARIELIFFLSITIARIGLALGQNGSILMNDTSFFLLLFIFVYYFNNKIVLKKEVSYQYVNNKIPA